MPFISDAQIVRVQDSIRTAHTRASRAVQKAHESELMGVAESLGGAALFGFLRGKMEEADGSWNVPGTTIDIESVVGLGLATAGAIGHFDRKNSLFGKYDSDVMFVGTGILSHYVGQVARKYGKSGAFSLVAGGPADLIAGNVGLRRALM